MFITSIRVKERISILVSRWYFSFAFGTTGAGADHQQIQTGSDHCIRKFQFFLSQTVSESGISTQTFSTNSSFGISIGQFQSIFGTGAAGIKISKHNNLQTNISFHEKKNRKLSFYYLNMHSSFPQWDGAMFLVDPFILSQIHPNLQWSFSHCSSPLFPDVPFLGFS